MSENDCVQVALRIRPLISAEVSRGCKDALDIIKELRQVRLKNSDKAFTFNHVFGIETDQNIFYNECVRDLIPNLFKGYNVTILAYGQTGSGKTHSMGTAYDGKEEMGVIPRAISDIFNYIKDNFSYDFTVTVTFMELYQETLYDLLSMKSREECVLEIREDINKGIFMPGVTEINVTTSMDTLECLQRGSLGRATASTNMNLQSSRSHAIFTINISMAQKGSTASNKTAKFHLVDLAGSERSKKTGATGQTFKEGVNINKGLLALGNVISALGDEKGQPSYICYRDSSLTRLLKDSLGGNSITLMIACVSPADYNVEETVSTLRYADRARKIKNKPVINEDPKTAEINKLNKLIRQLKLELVGQGGPIICPGELELIKKELSDTKIKITNLSLRLSLTLNENAALLERILIMQASNEALTLKLKELKNEYDITVTNLNLSLDNHDVAAIKEHVMKLQTIQSQFTDIDNEQKRNEDEIRKHELSVARTTFESGETNEKEIYERQESHTAQQIAMSSQLQEVTKMLAQKEYLAKQIAANTCHMIDTVEIAENQAKITALEKEKELLLQQLKSVQENQATHGPSAKIAEQRRKRVQELESQITDLNRRVHEQARLIKLKEKDEIKIRQLNNEIQNMKGTRVKLIKNMRQENEKFRSWKLQRERELLKLRDQDRKRQNQIVKMETIHSRQQNVLKRKVEEAAAINKRLKDALALRKVAQDTKLNGKIERLGPWIQREVEVLVSTIEAKTTLDILIEDRATLQRQVDELKDEESSLPRIQQLEDEIDLRSTQIQEIQQKVLDSDEGDKAENRFDNVQSMAEAKYTLKVLFDSIATIKRKEASKEYKITELQAAHNEVKQQVSELSNKIKNDETKHKDDIANLERENEEKVSVLLRQLRGIAVAGGDDELIERCKIQDSTIHRLEESVEKHKELIQELTQKITELESLSGTPPKRKKSKSKKQPSESDENIIPPTPLPISEESFEEDEDLTQDPDWRKTPLGRRVQQLKRSQIAEKGPSKRNLKGGCTCRGTCGTRTCGCKKFASACDDSCKCAADMCVNRNKEDTIEKEPLQETVNNVKMNGEGDADEEKFKKPRNKKTRKLFT